MSNFHPKALDVAKKTIYLSRSPEIQAALNGAYAALAPYVRASKKSPGYVISDVVRLSLKALARFISWLDQHHPGWETQTAGAVPPDKPHVRVDETEEFTRYFEAIRRGIYRGEARGELITTTKLIQLALTVIALYGQELNREFPGWWDEEG